MKNLLILLLVIGLFSGCAKNEPTLPSNYVNISFTDLMKTLELKKTYSDSNSIIYESKVLDSDKYIKNNFYNYDEATFNYCKAKGGKIVNLYDFSTETFKKYIEYTNLNTYYCKKDNNILFVGYKNTYHQSWQKYARYVYYFVESDVLSNEIKSFVAKKEKDEFMQIYTDVTTQYKDNIDLKNIDIFKFAIDSSYEDKFTNFNDTVFLIPNKLNVNSNLITNGYYVVLDSKIDLSTASFKADVKMPEKDSFLFMTVDNLNIKDKNGTKKILKIKHYLINTEFNEKGFNIYNLFGEELNKYISINLLFTEYKTSIDYDICNKNDIEVSKLLDNNYIFKTCKTYGKNVK